MAYEYIAEIIIGIILIYIGAKLDIHSPIGQLVRLGLVGIGLVVLAFGISILFAQFH